MKKEMKNKNIEEEMEEFNRLEKILNFTTKENLRVYIEDGMSSEGSLEDSKKMVDFLIEEEYFDLDWKGYHSTDKWTDLKDNEFFELWEKATTIKKE